MRAPDRFFVGQEDVPRWDNFQSSTVSALVSDPVQPGLAYAGFLLHRQQRSVGIYKTIDGGQNWVAKNSGLPTLGGFFQDRAVWDLAIRKSNPTRLYTPSEVGLQKPALASAVRSLALDVSGPDVILSWTGVAGAADYRVYASSSVAAAHSSRTLLGGNASTSFVDTGAAAGSELRVYSVVGSSTSGLDGVW